MKYSYIKTKDGMTVISPKQTRIDKRNKTIGFWTAVVLGFVISILITYNQLY